MSIEELEKNRIAKHQILGGTYSLGAGYDIDYVLSTFQEKPGRNLPPVSLDAPTENDDTRNNVTICGRVTTFRKTGKIAFLKLSDGSSTNSEIQVIGTLNASENYEGLKNIDLGDIIQVNGVTCFSKTNEPSVLVLSWKLLTKAILPPPEKFHGINDQEIKYRQRYLDLMSDPESRNMVRTRSKIVNKIRNLLIQEDFIEVETPVFHPISGGATALPFTTHHNALDQDFFLRIAPELYLKKLLVGGIDKVFEIGKNFRNEGLSSRHNPEFTMLEFYESYTYLGTAMDQFQDFLDGIISCVDETKLAFNINEPRFLTMQEAVDNAAKLDRDNQKELEKVLASVKNPGEELLAKFEVTAEPYLSIDYRASDGRSCPVFITSYPASICPLARPSDNDPNFCDRFELFIEGMEIANGYQELNDPVIQRKIFEAQVAGTDKKIDEDYITALKHGMPPAVGIGMGIDRLVMLLTGAKSIKEVILFPTLRT